MVLIIPDDGPTGLTTSIDALELQLTDMRAELEDTYKKIKAGDLTKLKDAKTTTTEIRQWLKIALEAEAQLEKRRKHERGIVNGYALDFNTARTQIGCRLDRLRRARCSGRVSCKPD